MWRFATTLALTLLSATATWSADRPAAPRVELPIRMVEGGGTRRFAVTVTIDGQSVDAGLDTGSTGLRVLAPALPQGAARKGPNSHVWFNAGVAFDGPIVPAQVGYGALPPVQEKVQRIDKISCRPQAKDCVAPRRDLFAFRIMHTGVAGQGFVAILGIGIRDETVGHPLTQVGVTRWIVELPRTPGETGRLVLNPAADEVARYKQVRFIDGRNELVGCLIGAGRKLCAPTMIDTGAPGISIFGGKEADLLPQSSAATLAVGDGAADAAMAVTIGRRDQAAGLRLQPPRPEAKVTLSFGIAPYLHWSILYDARARTLGVTDR